MNIYHMLLGLVLVSHGAQALTENPEAVERIKSQVGKSGFAYFADSTSCPFTIESLEPFRQLLQERADFRAKDENDAHKNSYEVSYFIKFNKDATSGGWRAETSHKHFAKTLSDEDKNKINDAIEKILKIVPASELGRKAMVHLVYYDEIRKEVEEITQSLKAGGNDKLKQARVPDLSWHRDLSGVEYYDFLFFVVFRTVGITEHFLQIGDADKKSITLKETTAAPIALEAQVLQSVKSQQGAGYLINQSHIQNGRVLVHKRTGFDCTITNLPMTDASSLNIYDINSNTAPPGREVLIVRIRNK